MGDNMAIKCCIRFRSLPNWERISRPNNNNMVKIELEHLLDHRGNPMLRIFPFPKIA